MFLKKYGDFIVSAVFLILGAALIIGGKSLPESTVVSVGPDFMPVVLGAVIIALAAILLVTSIVGYKEKLAALEGAEPDHCDYKRVLASLVLSIAYVMLLQPVGFLITTVVYLILQITALAPDENRKSKDIIKYVVISVVFTLIVYMLFRYGFKIVLPAGIFAINI